MATGRVLWFDVKKGYGFITRDNGSDVFVHYSKIEAEPGEFRVLVEGDLVEFEVFLAERGNGHSRPQAKNVRLRGGDDEVLQEESNSDIRGCIDRSETNPIQSNR